MTSKNEELCIAPNGCVKNLLQNIVKTGKNVLLYFEQNYQTQTNMHSMLEIMVKKERALENMQIYLKKISNCIPLYFSKQIVV